MAEDQAHADKISLAYLTAICAALDSTSLQFGERGDMRAALAALSAAQANLIATVPDGRMRKSLRKDCADHLLRYTMAAVGEDRGF